MKTSQRINEVLAALPALFIKGVELIEDEHDELPAYDMLSLVNRLEKLGLFLVVTPHYCSNRGGFYGYSGGVLMITPEETENKIEEISGIEISEILGINPQIHLFSFIEMLEDNLLIVLTKVKRALEKNPNLVFEIDVNQHADLK